MLVSTGRGRVVGMHGPFPKKPPPPIGRSEGSSQRADPPVPGIPRSTLYGEESPRHLAELETIDTEKI